jgi:hypothetical protein
MTYTTGQHRRAIPDIDTALGPTLRRVIEHAPGLAGPGHSAETAPLRHLLANRVDKVPDFRSW